MEIINSPSPVLNTPQSVPERAAPQTLPEQPPQGPGEAFSVELSTAATSLLRVDDSSTPPPEEPPPPPPPEAGTEELRTEGTTVAETTVAETTAAETTEAPAVPPPPIPGEPPAQQLQTGIAAFQQGAGTVRQNIDIIA